jgi:phospholipid transport system substrate-binding protein
MHNFYVPRRRLIAFAAAAALAVSIPAVGQAASPAIAPVQQLVDGLLQIMKAGSANNFQHRFNMLAPIIDRTFNLAAILRESVGPDWSTLSETDKSVLTDQFRRYTVASYVSNFDSFDGQRFEISPATRSVGAEQIVTTRIIPKSGTSHELDYVMRSGTDGWQVVDVLADGSISRVAVQRSDFRRLLAKGGAQALADSLRSKTAMLSQGTS